MDFRDYEDVARSPLIAVVGPTATGKTAMAVELARRFNGEIVSMDSRQVYRGMDIGTGKDMAEYREGGNPVPVHLVDVVEPGEPYDLCKYLADARRALVDIHRRRRLPILCGGTPLYLAALLDGYALEGSPPDEALRRELEGKPPRELLQILQREASPELLARTDLSQTRRIIRAIEIARSGNAPPPPPPLSNAILLAPKFTREQVRERIRIRLDARLGEGLVEEVQGLLDRGLPPERLEWFGLEYRYVGRFLAGLLTYEEMHDQLLQQIRRFAKRQDTWFRKLEREGHYIHWIAR